MRLPCINNNSGFLLIEAILAIALFGLMTAAIVVPIAVTQTNQANDSNRAQATLLAEAGVELVKNLTTDERNALVDGQYIIEQAGFEVTLRPGDFEEVDEFTRTVVITTAEDGTKQVDVTVAWDPGLWRSGEVTVSSYLTAWADEEICELLVDTTAAYYDEAYDQLHNVRLGSTCQNTTLVIDRAVVSWTGNTGVQLLSVAVGDDIRWDQTGVYDPAGAQGSGANLDLDDVYLPVGEAGLTAVLSFGGDWDVATDFDIQFVLNDGRVAAGQVAYTPSDDNGGGDDDLNITICYGANGTTPITQTIAPNDWPEYEANGALLGACPDGGVTDACVLWGMHDQGSAHSQLFSVDESVGQFAALGNLAHNLDIEGMDVHPDSNELYGVGGDNVADGGPLYRFNFTDLQWEEVGATGYGDLVAASFHPLTRRMWMMAEGDGLVSFNVDNPSETSLEKTTSQNFEGMAWDFAGDRLFLSNDRDLWVYRPGTDALTTLCPGALPGETEGLELRPDGELMGSSGKNFFLIDPGSCTISGYFPSDNQFNDVEAITFAAGSCGGGTGGGIDPEPPGPTMFICHQRGDGNDPISLEINESAWPAHEAHGDTIGSCQGDDIDYDDENPDFDVDDGEVIPQEEYEAQVEVLGAAITYGGQYDTPVTATVTIGETIFEPWGSFDQPVTANLNPLSGNPIFIGPERYEAGTEISVRARSYLKKKSSYSGESNSHWKINLTVDSAENSPFVIALRNGDIVPDIQPFQNQDNIVDFLEGYINAENRITIADNQVIYLFELGTSNINSAAADFQDLVLLVSLNLPDNE